MIKTSKEAYETQFKNKKILFDQHFSSIASIEFFKSNYDSFRYRAEFSLSKFDNAYSYTMTLNGKKERIDFFPIASKRIQELMPPLLSYINDNSIISDKLFQIEKDFPLTFRMSRAQVREEINEFGGTLEDFYHYCDKQFGTRQKRLETRGRPRKNL